MANILPGADEGREELHAAKREVVIYDHVDADEPQLAKMAAKREAGYKALGYEVTGAGDLFSQEIDLYRRTQSLAISETGSRRLRAGHVV